MSWVANFKRRVSLSIYRSNTNDPPDNPTPIAVLASLPESSTQADEPKTPELIRLEALFRILINPFKEEDSIKNLKEAVFAFHDSVIEIRLNPEACTKVLDGLDRVPEFFFVVAGYLSDQIGKFDEESKLPEDVSFLSMAFLAFRHLIQYQPQLVRTLKHTYLPKKLLEFNRFFLSNDLSKMALIGSDEAPLEADMFNLHQNNTLTLELLLLDDYFVKDIVLKGLAFDFFTTFLAFPEESGSELTGCAIRNAADRPNGLLSFLSSKGFMGLCCKKLGFFIAKRSEEQGRLIKVVRLINDLIEESSRKDMSLAMEFYDSGGYAILTELLVTGPFEGRYLDAKQFIISVLENLVFIGPEISKDELLSSAGVDDEMVEPISSLNGPSIRNHYALVPLLFCLLHPNDHGSTKLYPVLSTRINKVPLPNSFREAILTALVNLASIHPLNYLVINGHKVTQKLLEEFNTISFAMREMVMKLLTQSVQKFLHFPVKELALIPFCLNDAYDDSATLKLLYDALANIVGHSVSIKTITKEIGIFSSLISNLKDCLDEIHTRSEGCPQISLEGTQNDPIMPTERLKLLPQLLSAIAAFIKDDPELANDLSDRFSSGYFSFLLFHDTREPFLSFLEGHMDMLCRHVYQEQGRESSFPPLFSRLLGFLNSQRAYLSLTMACLDFLKRVLKDNQPIQLVFVKGGGFPYVLAILSDLKGLISSSSQKHFLVLQKALLVLVSCICGNPYAQWVLVHEVGVSTLLDHLDATDIFETVPLQAVAFGFLFGLVLGESSLLAATFADEVARLPEQLLFGTVRCPDLIPAIFHFAPKLQQNLDLERAVLNGLWSIINGSLLNQISFSQQNVGVNLLHWNDAILSRNGDNSHMLQTMTAMLHCLLELSANDIEVLKLLRGSYGFVSLDSLEILQVGLERGVGPSMFHFDCGADHPPSIVLSGVTRSPSSIGVHTTILWVQVVRLPEEGFIPLLRFTCNYVANYEVLLSPSRTITIACSDSLSIAFDGAPLQEEVWNHVVIIHTKAMLSLGGGSVSFYLNGSLAEARKVAYSTDSVRPEGTLVLGVTAHSSSAVWNLGPVSILDEALDSSAIASLYQLGPVYCGNFQDGHLICNASADTSKPFQIMPRDSKAYDTGCLVPRDKLAVSLRPRDLVLRNDTSQMLGAPNQRHSRLELAIASEDGIGWLSQGMAVSLSPHLALDLWKLGGCAVLLKLVADAFDAASLERALSILALAMRNDPRFGAEMVRIKGYDILGFLLKNKAELATPALIPLLRGLCMDLYEGYLSIQNATAFQCLFLDFEVWKGASLVVQGAVIGFIKDLVSNNPNAPHNLEILNGLGGVKRLLFALRYDHLQRALLPNCVEALRWLLVSSYTQENIRLVVSFITSTLSRDGKANSPMSSTYKFDRANIISDARTVTLGAHQLAVGNAVLEMLHDLLQQDSNCAKLASTITSKWLLLLYTTETNPYAIILATRILARLFLLGHGFISKFRSSYLGFAVLNRALPKWWFLPQLYHAVISMLLGVNIDTLTLGASFDFFSLVSLVSHDINTNKELATDATVILFQLIKSCLSACLLFSSDSLLSPREVSMTVEDLSLTPGIDEGHQNAVQISRVVQTLLQFFTELYHTSKGFRAICCRSPVTNIIAETLAMFSEGYNEFSASQFDAPTLHTPKTLESERFSSRALKGVPNPPQGAAPMPVHRRSQTMPEKRTPSTSEATSTKNEAVEAYMEFLLTVCCNGITTPTTKPLSEVEGILKAPFLGSFEGYTQFTNYFLSHVVKNLKGTLVMNPSVMSESKALVGIIKFTQLCVDSCYQGFFTAGLLEMFDLLSILAQNLASPAQPAEPHAAALMKQLNRMILYCLTEASSSIESRFSICFLKALLFQHSSIFSSRNSDAAFWRSFCHHLFVLLQFNSHHLRIVTFNIWKLMLLMKGQDLMAIFKCKDPNSQLLLDDFRHMLETDLEAFYSWFEAILPELSPVFAEVAGNCWDETFKFEKGNVQDALACSRSTLTTRAFKQHQGRVVESKAYCKAVSNTSTWAKNLQRLEADSYSRLIQDQVDSNAMVLTLWKHALSCSALLSEECSDGPKWKLDLTEGPYRMRRRLKPNRHDKIMPSLKNSPLRLMNMPSKLLRMKKGPELTITVADLDSESNDVLEDEGGLNEELKSDSKVHRVLRYLEPEDEVKDIFNIGRVSVLDVVDALLMFCTENVYVIDGYFLCGDGNIVETSQIPANERDAYIQSIAASGGSQPISHQCRRCAYTNLKEVHRRKFLFRNAALEIFFGDGRNLLITTNLGQRDTIYQRLVQRVEGPRQPSELTGGAPTEPTAFLGARLTNMILRSSCLDELTARWERRDITNFEYLMHLNTLAGRSYNDLTQYPVFPWVLSDYTSEDLDLSNPAIFRDLSKPMGAQSDTRAREFAQRFFSLSEAGEATPPFHYGTHYSSAMIVCWYLIRLEPFTSHHRALQGGHFDHPDRLFYSIKDTWLSAAANNTTDVRELIPEFYYLPEFLSNHNGFNFGARQEGGGKIDSVLLPPWARGCPEYFIRKHREALECDHVSAHLHLWIDLIFGYRQQGPAAVEALNVFHHLSYPDAVNLDAISDPIEKAATIGIINNFGQTPRQLFKRPHSSRPAATKPTNFDLGTVPHILIQSYRPLATFGVLVSDIILANDRVLALGGSRTFFGRQGPRHLEWGLIDNCLQLHQTDPPRLLACYEECHCGHITAVASFNDETFITGSDDQMVKVWDIDFRHSVPELTLRSILRGAAAQVTAIAACSPFGIAVIGTASDELQMWDIHCSRYIRKMPVPFSGVVAISIEKTSGTIAACTNSSISAWTVNGVKLASIRLPIDSPGITSCTFSETQAGVYSPHEVLVTGHQGGMLQIWMVSSDSLILIDALIERFSEEADPEEDITCILAPASRQALIVGNRKGEVYSYQFPDTTACYHRSRSESCCCCSTPVPQAERGSYCSACGGTTCILCVRASPFHTLEANLCQDCHQKYAMACP